MFAMLALAGDLGCSGGPTLEMCIRDSKVYVLEELDPFIEEHCKQIGIDVIGKDEFTLQGE